MKYIEKMVSSDGVQYTKKIVEESEELPNTKKNRQRRQIQDEVFDVEDAIADNAKMISLLTTMLNRLYGVMPEEQKSLLDTDDRNLIEYALNKKSSIATRADVQFFQEGAVPMIDKLFERQAKIGMIVA